MKNLLLRFCVALSLASSLASASVDEEVFAETWVDPVTKWTWTYASGFSNWKDARTICGKDTLLPSQAELRHAYKRIKASSLATKFKEQEVFFAWTREEFDWQSAMAVHLFEGFSRNIWKADLLGVLCLGK